MPKGFTEDGYPILTKEEFVKKMLVPRGYKKDKDGKWFLPKVEKEPVKKPKKIERQFSTDELSKELIIKKIKEFFEKNQYTFTLDKAFFLLTRNDGIYELKITKKESAFEFSESLNIKDSGKKQIVKELAKLDFCQVGIANQKGTIVGFTDGKGYFTASITKKRV